MDNKEYNKILKYTIPKIPAHYSGKDVVNHCYLLLIEAGKEYDYKTLKTIIRNYCLDLKYNGIDNKNDIVNIADEKFRYCKSCKEDKPIAAFSIVKRYRTNTRFLFHYCKDCQAGVMREYYKSDEFKAQRDEYRKKQKENLTDAYIKKLLINRGFNKEDITLEVIKKERHNRVREAAKMVRSNKSSTPFKCVYKKAKQLTKPYYVKIQKAKSKAIYLYGFETPEQAAKAYKRTIKALKEAA